MAPEVIKEEDGTYEAASDVYSYGILLWELLSGGKSPFENRTLA
jgi:serine/threonine protein kinase